jgi:hypothetical protein
MLIKMVIWRELANECAQTIGDNNTVIRAKPWNRCITGVMRGNRVGEKDLKRCIYGESNERNRTLSIAAPFETISW